MLDIAALSPQLDAAAAALGRRAEANAERLATALALFGEASVIAARRAEYAALAQAPWLLPTPLEPLASAVAPPMPPAVWRVVATDGSAIAPSAHDAAHCALLNVGCVRYTYGASEPPLADSRPLLVHAETPSPLGPAAEAAALSEARLGAWRELAALEALVALAGASEAADVPLLALVDGPLALHDAEPAHLAAWVAGLRRLEVLGVPVAGYVSASRSGEVARLLRLGACPFPALVCGPCAADGPACGAHLPVADARLFARRLREGERSALLATGAGAPEVAFFYLHVGSEVARIEVPLWVARAPKMLERVHALALAQARKGRGYPVALAEAHHRAVLTREDRGRFFALLARRLARDGFVAADSPKAERKRRGLA